MSRPSPRRRSPLCLHSLSLYLSLFLPLSSPISVLLTPPISDKTVTYRIIILVSDQTTDNMSTRSGAEFRAGTSAPVRLEEMPDWAKLILQNQEESKAQIEFLMAQLVELKIVKSTDALPLASTAHNDTPPPHAHDDQKDESPWDTEKRGAKPEVMAFDGSLDPKKYMDWEVGFDEYFDLYQLPEGRRLQFAQMKLSGQARIYWRNIQVTMERRQEPIITSWAEMKSQLHDKFVPACDRPMIIDEWQHLPQGDGTVAEYIA